MTVQVIERATGARMSYTPDGSIMGCTLFQHVKHAKDWMREKGLAVQTHAVICEVDGVKHDVTL